MVESKGKRVELFRVSMHIDKTLFAKKIGISSRTLYSRETDSSDTTHSELEKMVEMGANPEFLLTGKGPILREGFKRGND
ncbi:hypothetical protein [Sulfuricurvum sp.]|uniref:hypothetical protein n=1 Tax=Sulfuricurvum sp. TaxID=2025608 RepID=UPI00261C911C|nr:hypothetical protein [Sulfuricurvum sp.]MDD2267630.1 hypothetical protein [Sulfuricurvum sp.]